MHRFFTQQELQEGPLTIGDPAFAHQIRHVLRMRSGDEILLFTGGSTAGWDFRFCIDRLTERIVSGGIIERVKNEREPRVDVSLFHAFIKKDKMELVFEKGTEIGVNMFVPLLSERSLKRGIAEERAGKIVKEAAEQSGRAHIPAVLAPLAFENAVQFAKSKNGLNVLAHEKEARRTLDGAPPASRRITLFIGPEGGFSEKEVAIARNAGFFITSLSRRVLRAETAAIVGSYAVLHRFGN